MKKVFIYAIATLFSVFLVQAQDIKQAKNAIDAEQYEVAKNTLETITAAKSTDGYSKFLLGYVFLLKGDYESAKIHFDAGISCSSKGYFNYIGLGYLALDNGDTTEAEKYFALAIQNGGKKDLDVAVYTGKAYIHSQHPNYKKAIEILSKSRLSAPTNTDVLMALAEAYKFDKKQNDAYECYREAFRLDNTLLKAKMGLGTLIKNAHNFTGAIASFDEVIALNATYGPVYRELAETQYLWALNDTKNYDSHIAKGLAFYEKYMSLTDYSLESRMRHADFLILSKDFKALEAEANEMSKLDKVNPRIFRYLGYAAYYNNNFDTAISSLNSFVSNTSNRVIGRDYYYLGASKLSKALTLTPIDSTLIANGILDLKKSFEMSPVISGDLSDLGKNLYDKKLYVNAATVYEIATASTETKSKTYLLDNFYFASAVYWSCIGVENLTPQQIEQLNKADAALNTVIKASPSTQDAYLFKARIQVLLKNDALVAKNYEDFITTAKKKDSDELLKMKSKFVEAYNNLGIIYADTDKVKAKDSFGKTLEVDPANQYAIDQLKVLK